MFSFVLVSSRVICTNDRGRGEMGHLGPGADGTLTQVLAFAKFAFLKN